MEIYTVLTVCLMVASLSSADQHLTLTGFSNRALSEDCPPGRPCSNPPSLPSANITIYHGDDSCSILVLLCDFSFNKMELRLKSPNHRSEAVMRWVGISGNTEAIAYPPSSDTPCIAHSKSVTRMNAFRETELTTKLNECYTTSEALYSLDPSHETHSNVVEIVEFLDQIKVGTPATAGPSIHLISHTYVSVKCCWSADAEDGQCPSIGCKDPPCEPQGCSLTGCNSTSFSLKCESDNSTERFRCQVAISEGQTLLSEDVGYYVESCSASDASSSLPGGSVVLFDSSSTVPDSENCIESYVVRQACDTAGGADKARYILDAPWIQFKGYDQPHQVTITCTVKLAQKVNLSQYQLSQNPNLCNEAWSKSDAGFFQAGKITLLK